MTRRERVLILGGAGFMGRALSIRLQQLGHPVHAVTSGAMLDPVPGVSTHGGGIQDAEQLRRLLADVDVVVHVASATTPGLSRSAPSIEASGNIAPLLGLIEQLQHHARVRLVYVSSGGAIYGNADGEASESMPLSALSYYGAGKIACEAFLQCFRRVSGNRVAILRPSNVYGEGQPRYQGFAVIRTMLQHVLDDTGMEIWGDGSVVRDFLHVSDAVAAIQAAALDPEADGVMNVGAGVGHSLLQLKSIAEQVSGRELRVTFLPPRASDVQRIVLDSSAMQQRYGWRPSVSLEDGMRRTWRWMRERAPA